MNNFHHYTNFNSGKENPLGAGVYGIGPTMGSGNGSVPHPPNGGRNPSPQPAWGVGGASMQSRGGFSNPAATGGAAAGQSRLVGSAGRGRFNVNSNDMLMVLKKGLKEKEMSGVQDGDPISGIFDPSEFPSLGGNSEGGSGPSNSNGLGNYTDLYSSGSVYGSTFRNKAPDMSPRLDLRMQADDFPALSSNGSTNGRSAEVGGYETSAFGDSSDSRLGGSVAQSSQIGGLSSYGGGLNKSLGHNVTVRPRIPSSEGGSTGLIGEPKSGETDMYGMKGLLKVMSPNSSNSDLVLLSLGIDLTTLGLNLSSTGLLYENFRSPFGDRGSEKKGEPDYVIPSCYFLQPPHLKPAHFSKLQLESLFYIFYSMPRDLLQIYAALELYEREWRYHKDLKLWFARVPGTPMSFERGSYIYFDITEWERRPFHDANRSFVQGFLSQEEISSGVS